MGWEMGGRFKKEEIYVYLWLIHVEVLQKATKFCKAIILQKKFFLKNEKKKPPQTSNVNEDILELKHSHIAEINLK